MDARHERSIARCNEPLDLGPGARQAFADWQAKLVTWDRWPVLHWYNDEDFCRAYNTAVRLDDEVKRLTAIVECCTSSAPYTEAK